MSDIITDISKYKKGWFGGLPETPCGFGSKMSETNLQRKWIPEVIRKYRIKIIADIGAGDLNWITKMDLCGADYTAYDLVPRRKDVVAFDLVNEVPPQVDMIMCLWVLNHFPFDDCRKALENIMASGSRYLLMTYRPSCRDSHPPEIDIPYIEELVLNHKRDSIRLVPC